MRFLRLCSLLLAFSATTVALAGDTGWIVGGGVGNAKLQDFRLPTTVADDSDTIVRAFGGYKVMKHYAVTGEYLDFGSYHFEGTAPFGDYTTDIVVKGFHVDNKGLLPVGDRVELFAAVGVLVWDYEENDQDLNPPMPPRKLTDTGTSLTAGLGAHVDIFNPDGVGLHLELRRYFTVGDRQTVEHENDYDVVWFGLDWFFGK